MICYVTTYWRKKRRKRYLNYGAADLELVEAWFKVAEHLEHGGVANPDPGAEDRVRRFARELRPQD